MKQLTGPLAWSLRARAMRPLPWTMVANPHCIDINDWRKAKAIRTGIPVDRFTR